MNPPLYDPDFELAAVAELLTQVFPRVDTDDRAEILHEAGHRLADVASWLKSDVAWCPKWPVDTTTRRLLMAKRKRPRQADEPTAVEWRLMPDLPVRPCSCDVSHGQERFHQLGGKTRTVDGRLLCAEASKYVVVMSDGVSIAFCPHHYDEVQAQTDGQWPIASEISRLGRIEQLRGDAPAV